MPTRRGVNRSIYSALLDDPDYQRLSAPARLTLLTLRVCKQAGPAFIFRAYPAVLAAQTGLPVARLEAALSEIEGAGYLVREGPILWLKNALRYDPTLSLANPKHQKSVIRALEELPRLQIVLTFCDYYALPYPFDTHSVTRAELALPKTESRIPRTELSLPSHTLKIAIQTGVTFHVNGEIQAALSKAPTFAADPLCQTPRYWQAQLRAKPEVDFPKEILNAERWLAAHPERKPKRPAQFLSNWLARAEG